MTAPVFDATASLIGGRTQSTISGTIKTNSAGVNLYLDVYYDKEMTRLAYSSPGVALNAENDYTNTCYVSGITRYLRYYYRFRADDGLGNSVLGTVNNNTAGSFTPIPQTLKAQRLAFMTCYAAEDNAIAYSVAANLAALNIDQVFMMGDFSYNNEGLSVIDRRENYRQSWLGPTSTYRNVKNPFHTFWANTPGCFMMDDHERWNNCAGAHTWDVGQIAENAMALQVCHEKFMDCNKPYYDLLGRTWTHGQTLESWYIVDIPGVRVFVGDCRTFRDSATDTPDSPIKTMLGAVQLAALLNAFDTNPYERFIFASPVMWDGWHGYIIQTIDGGVAYNYERDLILEHIFASGKAEKTVIISGDTHTGIVGRYDDPTGVSKPVYEFMGGNLICTTNNNQMWSNGFKSGATGSRGLNCLMQTLLEPCCNIVELHADGSITLKLYELVTGKIRYTIHF